MAVTTHAPHGPSDNLRKTAVNRAGLWLFFFSESVLFGLLATSRFFLEGIEAAHLDQRLGLIITIILLLSSVTAYIAETAVMNDRKTAATVALIATMVMGVIFAGGVGYEWSIAEFSRHEPFGTVFFTMTGVHALHVISGIFLLGLVLVQMLRGVYGSHNYWAVTGVVLYWHFVDVVWVFFYPILYLVQGV
jgi:cytochrome c oxidase subunit III